MLNSIKSRVGAETLKSFSADTVIYCNIWSTCFFPYYNCWKDATDCTFIYICYLKNLSNLYFLCTLSSEVWLPDYMSCKKDAFWFKMFLNPDDVCINAAAGEFQSDSMSVCGAGMWLLSSCALCKYSRFKNTALISSIHCPWKANSQKMDGHTFVQMLDKNLKHLLADSGNSFFARGVCFPEHFPWVNAVYFLLLQQEVQKLQF